MLFENAQKKVLHGVNERLQQGKKPAVTAPAVAPSAVAPSAASSTATPSTQTTGQTSAGTQDATAQAAVTTAVTAVPSAPRQLPPCRTWDIPGEKPIAVLLCIHGLGLQSNSYEFFGKEISNRGIAAYAIDVRGFGSWMKSGGKTNVNFDDCLADIKLALESIRAANPGLPVYILGESMGGAIALRAASMYPTLVDGLISSVPAGERFNQGKTSAKVFLNLLAGFDLANVGGDIVNQATQNQKLKSQWTDDPLARLNLSPQELIQFQDFMNSNHEAAKKLGDMPVLFVQGNGDHLVKPEGTWELFNSVASKDKSFFAVPGEHLIFEEAQTQDPGPRDQNFRVIQSWLSTKVGRRRRPQNNAGNWGTATSMQQNSENSGFGRYGQNINFSGLEQQAQLVESGQYAAAIQQLEQILKQRPNDPNVMTLLGRAYYRSGQPDKAGYLFRSAMRTTRLGGDQARALNNYLLDMSRQAQTQGTGATSLQAAIAPFAGFAGRFGLGTSTNGSPAATSTSGSAATSTSVGTANNTSPPGGRGKIYAFYASWADQCKGLADNLSRLTSSFGNQIEVNKVNIEDAGSDRLIDQYKVGPIPTVVFVKPNGQVCSTVIGEAEMKAYEEALRLMSQSK